MFGNEEKIEKEVFILLCGWKRTELRRKFNYLGYDDSYETDGPNETFYTIADADPHKIIKLNNYFSSGSFSYIWTLDQAYEFETLSKK